MQPEVVQRLLKAVGMMTLAAIFGGIGTALVIKAVGDGNLLYAFFATLMSGVALLCGTAAVIAAVGGGRKPTSAA